MKHRRTFFPSFCSLWILSLIKHSFAFLFLWQYQCWRIPSQNCFSQYLVIFLVLCPAFLFLKLFLPKVPSSLCLTHSASLSYIALILHFFTSSNFDQMYWHLMSWIFFTLRNVIFLKNPHVNYSFLRKASSEVYLISLERWVISFPYFVSLPYTTFFWVLQDWMVFGYLSFCHHKDYNLFIVLSPMLKQMKSPLSEFIFSSKLSLRLLSSP